MTFFIILEKKFSVSQIVLKRVGKAKILCNIQGGWDEMLIIAYIVGGWVQKNPKSAYVIYGRSVEKQFQRNQYTYQ